MPGAPGAPSVPPGARGLPLEVLQTTRELLQTLEAILPDLERAEYWTGRRLWHSERRFRENTVQQRYELQQTLDAARGLHTAVCSTAVAVARAVRLGDSIFAYQSRAQNPSFLVDRGSGDRALLQPDTPRARAVEVIESCTQTVGVVPVSDAATQTPYLWPEGLGGFRALPREPAAQWLRDPVVERFPISAGDDSSSAEDVFWGHDGSPSQ